MTQYLLLVMIMLPILAAAALYLPMFRKNRMGRNIFVIAATVITAICYILILSLNPEKLVICSLTSQIQIAFTMDGVGKLFAGITIAMWVVSSIFQTEYLKHEQNEIRYQFFFLCSLSALLGVTIAENLITMYTFYEGMTLMTFPLVLHSQTQKSIAAAKKYLYYSIGGAFIALFGIFYLNNYLNSLSFVAGGNLNTAVTAQSHPFILVVVFLMLIGYGSKAGMFPLHGWLPTAHPVAPAPASALLSGNVTKIGVLAIIRVIYYVVGADFIRGTWVQYAFIAIALLTVLMGSMLAYKEQIMKKRLAYSTISQVSYILFGVALLNPIAMLGALLHVVYHSIVKNTLFLTSGAIIYKTGKTKVSELIGIGKEMPIVMWCYTMVSITLIGIPPTSAFVSKWLLAEGSLDSNVGVFSYLGPIVLLISALLTAGYLFSITIRGFFPGKEFDYTSLKKTEPNLFMIVPLVVLAVAAVVLGMFPNHLIDFLTSVISTIL